MSDFITVHKDYNDQGFTIELISNKYTAECRTIGKKPYRDGNKYYCGIIYLTGKLSNGQKWSSGDLVFDYDLSVKQSKYLMAIHHDKDMYLTAEVDIPLTHPPHDIDDPRG